MPLFVLLCHGSVIYFLSSRIVRGGNNICDGEVSNHNEAVVATRITDKQFGNKKQVRSQLMHLLKCLAKI